MIWNIFKKDWKLLWHLALGFALVQCLETIVRCRMDENAPGLEGMWQLLETIGLLGAGFLIAAVVQVDAIPGVRQDWLVRPIKRKDLLCAKLLFVILLVQGPVLLANWAGTMAHGFPWEKSLVAALLFSLSLLAGYYVPVLGLASLTRNLMEAIVAIVIAACAYAGFQQLTGAHAWFRFMLFDSGVNWVLNWTVVLVLLFGAAAILAIQYLKRKTLMARGMAISVCVLCVILINAPWQPVFAIQQRMSPAPGSASSVKLTFQPEIGRFGAPYGGRSNSTRTGIVLPVGISGLPPDSILFMEWVTSIVTGADGKTVELGRATTSDESLTSNRNAYTHIWVPDGVYAKLKDRPARLEIDYSLTLLRLSEAHAIPAVGDPEIVPGAGRCGTKVNADGTMIDLRCTVAGMSPPCGTFFLEHAPSGRRNPPMTQCRPSYALFFAQMVPDAMDRFGISLPIHDIRYPVDGPELEDSRLVMRIYKPEDHFTRQVVIPDIRLSDWVPRRF